MSGFVPFHALMASAGSGKTFSLVVRYLGLLFMDERADEILALTFTNKAAGEMQERIIETLTHLQERDELQAIAELCSMAPEAVLGKRAAVLRQVLNLDTKVMTIDRFFAGVLRKFALHAGIMPNFGTFEAQHDLKVMSRFLRLCEIEGKSGTLVDMALLTAKRLKDLFALLDELYAKGPQLAHLSFGFADRAVHDRRAMQLHARLLETVEGTALSARGRKALQAANIEEIIGKGWAVKPSFEYWDFKKIYTPGMDALLRELQSEIKAYMDAKEQQFFAQLFELASLYKSAKLTVAKEDNELGFDDVTALVHYLLKERIDSDFLYFRLDSRLSHLLLDEFQDTSVIQFEILRPLIEEMIAGSGVRPHRSFFLVGDTKQSIYRFRGGTKALFGAVTHRYGLQVDPLRTNYRSSRNVVGFVNDVFRSNMPGYEDQHVRSGADEGYVEVTENEAVLEQVGIIVERLRTLGAAKHDIAVLTATNSDGEAVQTFLAERGINVVTETTARLINQKRVRALIEYLKYSYFGEAIYARNFCALADLPPQLPVRFEIRRGGLVEGALKIIESHGVFDGDLNVVRFVENLAEYEDMEAFLFEHERMEAKAVSADAQGVRVMTVHKSKGLEFPYVIVMDRLGKKRSDTAPILYEYDGIRLENLYLRQQNRKELDPRYAAVLQREAELAEEDTLNALYVAFTRARENLYVIQKPKGSMFELLELAAARRGIEQVNATAAAEKGWQEKLPYAPLRLGRQEDVVAVETDADAEKDPFAITYGLALHYALEMMESFTGEALPEAMAAAANRYGALLGDEHLAEIGRRIARLTKDPRFAELVRGDVRKEQPLCFRGEVRYLDLLVKQADGWAVIDYKSARSKEAKHHEQVGYYLRALEAITGEKAEGYLCYLLADRIEIVEVVV